MKPISLVAAAALALAPAAAGAAPPRITAQTLVDRAEIMDLLTRYYTNLGRGGGDSFSAFYADDAELVLGTKSYKGKDGITSAYTPPPDAKPSPQRNSFAFNVLLNNPLIVVHGDTATARLVFTEVVVDKQGDAPRILVQGREFDNFVRLNGEWRIAKRHIMGAEATPDDWKE